MKGVQVEVGRVCGVGPARMVLRGSDEEGKGLCEGVRRELRCVEIGSSMRAREVRRKVRRALVLKQREGVSVGGGWVGVDMVGGGLGRMCLFWGVGNSRCEGGEGGDDGVGVEGDSAVIQNHASLST